MSADDKYRVEQQPAGRERLESEGWQVSDWGAA